MVTILARPYYHPFALKLDGEGNLEKCVAGNLKHLKKNGVTLVEAGGIEDYLKI